MRMLLDQAITLLSRNPSRWVKFPLALVLGAIVATAVFLTRANQVNSLWRMSATAPVSQKTVPTVVAKNEPESSTEPNRFAEIWDKMVQEMEKSARSYPGSVAIYIKDLKHGREWTYHADDLFPAASLIKVPVMACVFDKINHGELSLNDQFALRRSARMGGSGSLKWRRDGSRFTVRELLDRMIDESDNTAQRMLIEAVSMGFLQQQFPKIGLLYTEIYPEGLSLNDNQVRYENYTTAREMSMLFEKIYKGEMVDKLSSEMMLEILKLRRPKSRLAKGLPVGWEIAHKTGLLRHACHDSSIIFSPEGDYVLTVLTGRNRSYSLAKDFITKMGRITYRHYKSDLGLYAKALRNDSSANRSISRD